MSVLTLIRENWKGVVVGVAVAGASMYGGPLAGKAVEWVLPKALEHISTTPITDLTRHTNPFSVAPVSAPVAPRARATLAQVARDWGIQGRLDCRVVQR